MEIPVRLGTTAEEEELEEYDSVFYEDIEAPKFVDLTAPDAACPTDDPSWFCLRVGCDQMHEHVDPEALHRSFVMRVMAARSPNVRLQKAISRRNQSSMLPKCPHSAPAKPPRTRMTRLSLMATGPAQQAARARLNDHRIRTLRNSPVRTRAARVEPSNARKKALTTPRSKAVLRPRQEPFLSAKHQKEPVAAAETKGAVVKALFMTTPKKETPAKKKTEAPPVVAEVCSKMKKLNLACREVPSRYLAPLSTPKTTKNCEQTAAAAVKSAKRVHQPRTGKKILGLSAKCGNAETDSGRQNINADENSCKKTARRNWERKEVQQGSRIEVEPLQPDNHDDDDDKENVSCGDQLAEQASNRQDENINQVENKENATQKVLKRQISKVNADQGGKLKKTIQKPFRLRTDERQVLKEAHPERKQTGAAEKNIVPILKDENRRVMIQKKQNTHPATSQLGEPKTGLNSTRCNNVRPALAKGQTVEKSQRVTRTASSTRTAKITSGVTAPSRIGKERKTSVKTSRLQAAPA